MNNTPSYKTEEINSEVNKMRFLFESVGKKSIIKAIEYSLIETISGRKIFNLGFGDYSEKDGTIIDDISSNNGDMRKVFSTVLNTVPEFFKANRTAAIWIQGSDSEEDYKMKCKTNCSKNCDKECKNFNRRIKTYKYFVDRNFNKLSKEYIFFGYLDGDFVQYVPDNEYIGILVSKKK